MLQNKDYKKNFYSEEELECFDKIGNLLIIPKHTNSEFGHKDPSEKWKLMNDDKKYIGGLRYLDSFVKSYEEDMKSWNFDLIKKRSNTIAREVYEIFNY